MSDKLVTLVHKETLAPTIVSLLLKPQQPIQYHAGQYIMLGFDSADLKPFSIAAAPREDGLIECHIRDHDNGEWMQRLFALQTGDQLLMQGPKEQMQVADNHKPVIFVAGGTGFAPMKALLEELIRQQAGMPIDFYWGARCKEDLYMHQQMIDLSQKHPNIEYIPVISDEVENWNGATGLVHQQVLKDHPHLEKYQVYLCGPWAMQQTAKADFIEAGLSPDNFVA
ncbi:NAD(P)H-flavin reductase [Thiomicrorhabdus sp. 6S3-12]|uniref:NAD(P)H-flavin reductase n=1 Tax=Thiomicrorhabdus sp. 6S3-12 TaxID=2819681 RepID=UPI001AACCE40|nr:NAD(P)H-flavin reductase [Thiomicrorhabdus sp. 6S3-12]MBO1924617.1 NAD(P)H-flavin reductase [Thiomicrorhabdus sp. 6S3-12]